MHKVNYVFQYVIISVVGRFFADTHSPSLLEMNILENYIQNRRILFLTLVMTLESFLMRRRCSGNNLPQLRRLSSPDAIRQNSFNNAYSGMYCTGLKWRQLLPQSCLDGAV